MKKSKWLTAGSFNFCIPRKIVLKMKLTLIFILAGIIQVVALNSYSQSTKITMELRNVSVVEALKAIENKSEFYFVYNKDAINMDRKVDINVKKRRIDQILDYLFKETNVSYKILDRHIVLSTLEVVQQQKSVSGKVTDSGGAPLPGVTVVVKGTTYGTVTNADGEYSTTNIPENTTLVFSFVGMKTQEIPVGANSTINVTMEEISIGIDEVVAIGYGVANKSDLTGSVVRADLETFREQPNVNIAQSLQGTIPGLNVGITTEAGGTPSIRVRSLKTINGSSQPLIVLDGIIYRGSMADLNPDDIESIDLLKDASSAAIYGSQAANGVLILTTKRGVKFKGKPMFNYSGYYSIGKPVNTRLHYYDSKGFLNKMYDYYWKDAFLAPEYTQKNPNWDSSAFHRHNTVRDGFANGVDNNWYDLLTQDPTIMNHNLSVTGSTEKTSYFISTSFTDQQEGLLNDDYSKWTIRINMDNKITDWLTMGIQSFVSSADYSGASPDFRYAYLLSPAAPYKNEETGKLIQEIQSPFENPFHVTEIDDFDKRLNLMANFYTKVDIPFIKGLSYRLNFSNNYQTTRHFTFDEWGYANTGSARKYNGTNMDWTLDNILSFERTFNDKHKVGATVVYGRESRSYEDTDARSEGFSSMGLGYNFLEGGKIEQQKTSSGAWEENSLYSMGRLMYGYNKKYLGTFTIRRDGFSGFGKNKKWGIFPSVAGAWVVSEEDFLNGNAWLNYLKLRASYGVSGNRTVGRYATLAKVTKTPSYSYGYGATAEEGQYIYSLANNDLGWETTTGWNFGIDFSLLDQRISGNIEYYDTKTEDLLYNINLPEIGGISSISTNIGQIDNHGFEFAITSANIQKQEFQWSSTLSFSLDRNKVVSILGQDNDGDGIEDDLVSSGLFMGKDMTAIYDYSVDGLYQIGDNIPAGYNPGSYRIVDSSGPDGGPDGIITADDRSILGYEEPAYRVSLQNEFKYKNWSLMVFFNSIQGGKNRYLGNNSPHKVGNFDDGGATWNMPVEWDYWSPRNPDAEYPALLYIASVEPNVYKNRSFVRLQNVSLSYSLGKGLLNKMKIDNAKVFISGKNLYTWTKWKGWDPEAGYGLAVGGRPLTTTYTIGLNVSF